jgi:hypothetical protein
VGVLTGASARACGGGDVFEWAAALEDVLSDFLAEKTVVREVSNWDLHFPRDVV